MSMPKGFKELVEYMSSQKDLAIDAASIQCALQEKHGMTSGAVTGVIHRAEEQGVISKVSRGWYQLTNTIVTNAETTTPQFVTKAISEAVLRIETQAGKQITELSTAEVAKVQEALLQLRNLLA